MPVTDPISDYLTRIRKAVKARRVVVEIPSSKMKLGLADILKKNNFIDKLAGTTALRKMIVSGNSYEEITDSYKDNLKIFSLKRENYILYK